MEIAGKVVLITGASSGIGLATARLFARKGAKLALTARSADKLAQLASELPDALVVPTDLHDEAAVRRMVTQTDDSLIILAAFGAFVSLLIARHLYRRPHSVPVRQGGNLGEMTDG